MFHRTTIWRCAVILFVLLGSINLYAQPALQWAKCYGGTGNDDAFGLEKAWGGGFVIVGDRQNCQQGGDDIWLVKTDDLGNQVWAKCYGGSQQDYSYSIERVKSESDSGYIIVGLTLSNDGDVTGYHGMGDAWVVKTDASGTLQWQKALGGSGSDRAYAVKQTLDGGFIVASETESNDGDVTGNHGMRDFWIVKLSKTGNILWQKTLGGTLDEYPLSIESTMDGGTIVAGAASSSDGDVSTNIGMYDYWVVKLDTAGSIQWEKSYGGFGIDYATSISQTSDSGFILSGHSTYNPQNNGQYHSVIKIDRNGVIQISARPERTQDVVQTSGGDYVSVIGSSTSGYIVNKTSSNGSPIWTKTMGGSLGGVAKSVIEASDRSYVIAGFTHSTDGDVTGNHGGSDFWVVKLVPEPNEIPSIQTNIGQIAFYPNPAKEEIRFSEKVNVQLVNVTGQVVKESQNVTSLDISACPAGIYFLAFYNTQGEVIQTGKIVKE